MPSLPWRSALPGSPRHSPSTAWSTTASPRLAGRSRTPAPPQARSEEHTSELQSQSNLVCRLLLEKKKLDAGHAGVNRLVRAAVGGAGLEVEGVLVAGPAVHPQQDAGLVVALLAGGVG